MFKKALKWSIISGFVMTVVIVIAVLVAPSDGAEPKNLAAENVNKSEDYAKAREENGGFLPELELEDALKASGSNEKVTRASVVGDHVAVWADVEMNLTSEMTYDSARKCAIDIFEVLSELDDFADATIIVNAPGIDAHGNDVNLEAIKVTWAKETIDKINYKQFSVGQIGTVAEFYSTTE